MGKVQEITVKENLYENILLMRNIVRNIFEWRCSRLERYFSFSKISFTIFRILHLSNRWILFSKNNPGMTRSIFEWMSFFHSFYWMTLAVSTVETWLWLFTLLILSRYQKLCHVICLRCNRFQIESPLPFLQQTMTFLKKFNQITTIKILSN